MSAARGHWRKALSTVRKYSSVCNTFFSFIERNPTYFLTENMLQHLMRCFLTIKQQVVVKSQM